MKHARILVLLLFTAAGVLFAGERIDERVDASRDGRVEIQNIAGSVSVVGWDRAEVQVTGTLGQGTERLDVDRSGDTVHIEVILPRGRNHNVKGSDLEVRVPRDSELQISTVSAGIDIDDVDGSLVLESVSGGIVVQGGSEDVEAHNVSGAIRIDAPLRRADLKTVSGGIEATLDASADGRFRFDSVSGGIRLRVPSRLGAEFDVSTFSGSIRSDFGPAPEKTSRYTSARELSFSMGDGRARISINAFSGSVVIEED